MGKCPSAHPNKVATQELTPKPKWEKIRRERDLLRPNGCDQMHKQKSKSPR